MPCRAALLLLCNVTAVGLIGGGGVSSGSLVRVPNIGKHRVTASLACRVLQGEVRGWKDIQGWLSGYLPVQYVCMIWTALWLYYTARGQPSNYTWHHSHILWEGLGLQEWHRWNKMEDIFLHLQMFLQIVLLVQLYLDDSQSVYRLRT